MILLGRVVALLATLGFLPQAQGVAARLSRYEYTEYHMGVDVRLIVYAPDRGVAETACAAAFERFAQLDWVMSDYRDRSELMRLCAHAGGPPVRVSRDLFTVLQRSQELARQSGGAFDITCSPVVRLWRLARKTGVLPSAAALAEARSRVGSQYLRLNRRRQTAQLLKPRMQLDLGGIGKGYADDCAQRALKAHGITRALVEAGGDIVVTDPPPGESGWRIDLGAESGSAAHHTLTVANAAVSTSGDTAQHVDIGGKRYSHIVDPRTGWALTDGIAVTVVARDGLTSDGLSTAVSVLGERAGRALAARYSGTTVYIHSVRPHVAAAPPCAPGPLLRRYTRCVSADTSTTAWADVRGSSTSTGVSAAATKTRIAHPT